MGSRIQIQGLIARNMLTVAMNSPDFDTRIKAVEVLLERASNHAETSSSAGLRYLLRYGSQDVR